MDSELKYDLLPVFNLKCLCDHLWSLKTFTQHLAPTVGLEPHDHIDIPIDFLEPIRYALICVFPKWLKKLEAYLLASSDSF
jgi:hypothetical protein